MYPENLSVDRFLRMPEVLRITGISRAQVYVLMSQNKFPRQTKISDGGKAAGWLQSEVAEWMNERLASRAIVAKEAS